MATGRNNSYSTRYGLPGLLFIEPPARSSTTPLIDEATRKMTAALRQAREGEAWRGFHQCSCRARSGCVDLIVEGRFITNSLAIHYLAMHRDVVPFEELQDVLSLTSGEAEPTERELG